MRPKNFELSDMKGAWALVTGASSGIGREFCVQLAARGINLVLVARRTGVLEELAAELRARAQVQCLTVGLDLSQADAPSRLKTLLEEKGVRIRMLVNNAGCGRWGGVATVPPDFYREMMTLNAVAPVVLSRLFFEDLVSFDSSVLINVSSPAVFQPVPYMAAYAASKSALHSFSLALSEEWRGQGVLVQTLVPGPTQSEFDVRAGAYESALGEARDQPSEVVASSLRALDAGKILVCVAKGTFGQRVFGSLFPPRFVVRKVAAMFGPKTTGSS